MEYLIYDCEIVKCIPNRDGTRIDGLEYCNGWDDHANMSISVVGWWDSRLTQNPLGYWANGYDVDLQERINWSDRIIVGFNSRNFDDKLMFANGVTVTTDYDLLEEIRIAAYGSPSWEDQPKGSSYSLDSIARANGMAKTGNGALAPQLWQQGKHQEVIDYCLMDIKITKALLDLGLDGQLIDPNTGDRLELRPLDPAHKGLPL